MIKIIIYSIVLIATLLYISEPKFSLSPFKITLTKGWFTLGMILIGTGIGFIRYQAYKDGTRAGVDASFKYIKELINKEEKI